MIKLAKAGIKELVAHQKAALASLAHLGREPAGVSPGSDPELPAGIIGPNPNSVPKNVAIMSRRR